MVVVTDHCLKQVSEVSPDGLDDSSSSHAKHKRTPRTVQHVRRHVTLCIGDLEVSGSDHVEMRALREVY